MCFNYQFRNNLKFWTYEQILISLTTPRDKSTLFMASPSSAPQSPTSTTTEAIYARIDYDDSFENDRSTDSGFSDRPEEMYECLGSASLTSDDISLLTRYEGVLKNRSKKSRFKKLSELLCSGGSTSGGIILHQIYCKVIIIIIILCLYAKINFAWF